MTPEQALIAQAGPYMLAAKARELIKVEITKGCSPQILPECVALEPSFSPIVVDRNITDKVRGLDFVYEPPPAAEDIVRFQVWISPEQEFDWNRCEILLKQLISVSRRVGLEIFGNKEKIVISLLCHSNDVSIVSTSFQSEIKQCRLSLLDSSFLPGLVNCAGSTMMFFDYFPVPPYSHLLTRPNEFMISPYDCLFAALAEISSPSIGLFQVLFQPVSPEHNWHKNVEVLLDLEFMLKLSNNPGAAQRYAQQAPSGDLRQMAYDVGAKAHNDKPLFSAALRIAVMGNDDAEEHLKSLDVFSNIFQHGSRRLNSLNQDDYSRILDPEQIRRMFLSGLTYRPGFLVNSAELVGLAHVPPAAVVEDLESSFDLLDPISDCEEMLKGGTKIGTCKVVGEDTPVFISEKPRLEHTHIIGRPGTGKSLLMQHMILDDIEKGHGVAVFDPHGDMVEELLYHIPESMINKVIYFDPGDTDWVPLWNPMEIIPGQDLGRTADNFIGVFKSFVTGWGDRMETFLRHAIFALLHIQGSTLQDISDVLRKKSKKRGDLHKLILEVIENEEARTFWANDFDEYKRDEFAPARHKLSKLLVSGTVSLMLSQPNSTFNFRNIMDDGMIFLANLSKLGSEVKEILGGFMLAIMHITAISRSEVPLDSRKTFHIYLDEAHRFVTDSLEDIIAETRKFGVSMTLAHQFMSQFGLKKADALSGVGTTIAFRIDTKDAAFLGKNFMRLVELKDFIGLGLGEAVMHSEKQIARIKTPGPIKIPEVNFRDKIIEQSRMKYCRTAHEVRKMIKQRGDRANKPFTPLVPPPDPDGNGTHEEFTYDELRE